jgi:hypothetical protein
LICSRCGRDEFLPPTSVETEEDNIDLVVTFLGKTHQLKDLCTACKKTCGTYVKNIIKDVKASRTGARKKRAPGGGSSP